MCVKGRFHICCHICRCSICCLCSLSHFHPHQSTSLSPSQGWTKPLAGPDWAVGKVGRALRAGTRSWTWGHSMSWHCRTYSRSLLDRRVSKTKKWAWVWRNIFSSWEQLDAGGDYAEFVLSPPLVDFSLSCLHPWWFSPCPVSILGGFLPILSPSLVDFKSQLDQCVSELALFWAWGWTGDPCSSSLFPLNIVGIVLENTIFEICLKYLNTMRMVYKYKLNSSTKHYKILLLNNCDKNFENNHLETNWY